MSLTHFSSSLTHLYDTNRVALHNLLSASLSREGDAVNGDLLQVLRVLPYSAAQLCGYDLFKKAFTSADGELTVPRKLASGACAGMFSTMVRSLPHSLCVAAMVAYLNDWVSMASIRCL